MRCRSSWPVTNCRPRRPARLRRSTFPQPRRRPTQSWPHSTSHRPRSMRRFRRSSQPRWTPTRSSPTRSTGTRSPSSRWRSIRRFRPARCRVSRCRVARPQGRRALALVGIGGRRGGRLSVAVSAAVDAVADVSAAVEDVEVASVPESVPAVDVADESFAGAPSSADSVSDEPLLDAFCAAAPVASVSTAVSAISLMFESAEESFVVSFSSADALGPPTNAAALPWSTTRPTSTTASADRFTASPPHRTRSSQPLPLRKRVRSGGSLPADTAHIIFLLTVRRYSPFDS